MKELAVSQLVRNQLGRSDALFRATAEGAKSADGNARSVRALESLSPLAQQSQNITTTLVFKKYTREHSPHDSRSRMVMRLWLGLIGVIGSGAPRSRVESPSDRRSHGLPTQRGLHISKWGGADVARNTGSGNVAHSVSCMYPRIHGID